MISFLNSYYFYLECDENGEQFRLYNQQTSEDGVAVTGIPQVCAGGVWTSVCNLALSHLSLPLLLCRDLGYEGK